MDIVEDQPQAVGTVLEQDRGSLPFATIHGEALVACAAWALSAGGVTPIDFGTGWDDIVEGGEPVVLHDSLCPMTPPEFIAECVRLARDQDVVVVGVRPVIDTVKEVTGDVVGGTVNRDDLYALASPTVIPGPVAARLDPGRIRWNDPEALVSTLAEYAEVRYLQAPPAARRVTDEDDLRLLEALTEPSG